MLTVNGKNVDYVMINNSCFKYKFDWLNKNQTGAAKQNAIYRGKNLGALTDDMSLNIKSGNFDDFCIGDYFTVGQNQYTIAGINYKIDDDNPTLNNHLVLLTSADSPKYQMNPTATTEGGFVGSDFFKNSLPTIVDRLEKDFGDHLLSFNEKLTDKVEDGVPTHMSDYTVKACMCSSKMVSGSVCGSTDSGKIYNSGNDNQLPIYKLRPNLAAGNANWYWLRDVTNATDFALINPDGIIVWDDLPNHTSWYGAKYKNQMRAYFLIN